jgi:predicted dehydrogenase/threonine dehydrogenase-like Zn-dependent dehydrogenase
MVSVAEVAAPGSPSGSVLVHTRASLISAGTEGAALRFGKQSLLQKARSRPDLVKQVVEKVRSQGLRATFDVMQARLDVPLALGYSSAGEVLEVGHGVGGLKAGHRVACAGGGYASHADVVAIPKNLVIAMPEGVTYEEASFATVGAVALQGLRVADVRMGERVFVIGLGLIGLLTVQLLKAAGCLVLGTDLNPARVALARELGADEAHLLDAGALAEAVEQFTRGRGADAVLITAATKSNEPVELAGEVCRLKGRVVAVGDVRMDIPRRTYYEKELDLRVSRSYGPGRYDPSYEEKGIDYPYAYVPFTQQRNMETFLQLVAEGKVTPGRLITHRFPIEEAEKAYAVIQGEVKEPYLGVVFSYADEPDLRRKVSAASERAVQALSEGAIGVGIIGAGNYARLMLLPRLKGMKEVRLVGAGSTRGLNAWDAAKRFGFEFSTTETEGIFRDSRINLVVIATRHGTHASLAEAALRAGKHVFVEKPLATTEEDLQRLVRVAGHAQRHLMVGFNRRFAPLIQQAKEKFRNHAQPLAMFYRVNAGAVPASHWTQDAEEGGGRIVGEVCHFVDLLQFLCGAAPISVFAASAAGSEGRTVPDDIVTITIRFADGSVGTIHYFANGDKSVPKEYLEVYGGGRTFILDDFRAARYAEAGKTAHWKSSGQDKGQSGELQSLVEAIRKGGPTPIPLDDSVFTTLTTLRILDSLRLGTEVNVGWQREMESFAEDVPPLSEGSLPSSPAELARS